MITFPNAKINLGLNITSKRPDGYHEISSCFLPIDWKDALEAVPAKKFKFTSTGLDIPGDPNQNLSVKAYEMLRADFGIEPVDMHLHKVIPMGAGLGGGSADGAFCLKLLNDLFDLNISTDKLEGYAKELGADCPFFIKNTPRLVAGIGEVFEDITLDLTGYHVVVVYPKIHVNTGMAFSKMTPKEPDNSVKEKLLNDIKDWKNQLVNDFEKPVFEMHPEIKQIKKEMNQFGALYASMSGSGSSVYGIYPNETDLSFTSDYLVWSGLLSF